MVLSRVVPSNFDIATLLRVFVGDELCEFLLFGLCRVGRTHVFRNCIQLLFNSSELLQRSVIMLT